MTGNPYERFVKQIVEGTARQTILQRAIETYGTRAELPILVPYVVIETIFDPTIIDDRKVEHWINTLGVSNIEFASILPRNSVIAQRVQDGGGSPIDPPMFLFPLFAELSLPCNPGEQLWVIFPHRASKKMDLGYWMCRIVGPGFVEDANHVHMPRMHDPSFVPTTKDIADGTVKPVYEFRPGNVVVRNESRFTDAETITLASDDEQIFEKLMTTTDAGKLRSYEPVPRIRKRPGDIVIEGRNNASIVIGRHRTGPVAEYAEDELMGRVPSIPVSDVPNTGAGMIDVVAGRGQTEATGGKSVDNSLGFKELDKSSMQLMPGEGDPDFSTDRSRLLVAQKMPVDANFQLDALNIEFGVGTFQGAPGEATITDTSVTGDGAVVIKSDKVRIIARSDVELLVSGFERAPDGQMISVTDPARCAALVIKANGDIVLRPATTGYIKLGGDEADKALVCTDSPAIAENGNVSAPPLQTTMGGFFAGTNIAGQGLYASKILVVAKKPVV